MSRIQTRRTTKLDGDLVTAISCLTEGPVADFLDRAILLGDRAVWSGCLAGRAVRSVSMRKSTYLVLQTQRERLGRQSLGSWAGYCALRLLRLTYGEEGVADALLERGRQASRLAKLRASGGPLSGYLAL